MKKFTSILFTVILFELILGGGGRLISYGSVSLRMVLFGLAMLVTCFLFLKGEKISKEYCVLIMLFALVLAIGFVRGYVAGASREFWWEDLKPLSYFFILPFFGFAITEYSTVELTARIIRLAGIILSSLFIILLILIHTGTIPFLDFYHTLIGTQEFFFRGELTFFYKGFIYICIAFLFVYFSENKYKHFILILLATGVLLSLTRGFLLALALTYTSYYLLKSSAVRVSVFAFFSILILLFSQKIITKSSQAIDQMMSSHQKINPNPNLFGNKSYADEGRFQQIKEVSDRVDFSSLVIGHGFGVGIPSRPVHMEISYVEIFHKQGLVGLAFWAYLLWLLYQKYKNAEEGLRDPFFFGALFVYFQSLTNQYVNNPIGLSLVLLSIVCLNQLKRNS